MSNPIQILSDQLAATIEALQSTVVRVDGRRRMPASGTVWAPGTIVTASHVLQRDTGFAVGLPGGARVPATLVGRDHATDLAVLKVDADGLVPAVPVPAEQARVGQVVVALGRTGRTLRAALGILNAAADTWRTPAGGRIERFLQADLDLPSGFSGGALVDAQGRLVGVTTAGLLRGRTMVIPPVTLQRVVEALASRGRVERGYIGIGSQPVRLEGNVASAAGQESALLVLSVQSKSPAEAAGLMLGDAILAFDGAPLRHVGDLLEHLDEERVGKEAVLHILRAGAKREIRVRVGGRGWS